MKKIIIENATSNDFIIQANNDIYIVKYLEKLELSTDAEVIYVNHCLENTAKFKIAFEYNPLGSAPSWIYRPIYFNKFDAYFYINDIYKYLKITEKTFLSSAGGFALFSIFTGYIKDKQILQYKYHCKFDRNLYNIIRLLIKIPLVTLAMVFTSLIISGFWLSYDPILFAILFLDFLGCLLVKKVVNEHKKFYNFETNPKAALDVAENIEIIKHDKYYIKYKILFKEKI